jgi:D-glycero-beta-D-manno-heptose 1-phosphate adenylyltransferase
MTKKFKSQKEIFEITKKLKQKGKTIVTFNGSFDILHSGHTKSFREAKNKGDYLIIFINSDKSVKSYKGKDRPIISEKHRAEMVASLSYVDYVALFNESDPRKVLSVVKPDIHCNGAEWGKDCIEKKTVEKNGGKIHILKQYKGISTTEIIKKILKAHTKK